MMFNKKKQLSICLKNKKQITIVPMQHINGIDSLVWLESQSQNIAINDRNSLPATFACSDDKRQRVQKKSIIIIIINNNNTNRDAIVTTKQRRWVHLLLHEALKPFL